jgi:FkbM family methyltransferase
VVDIGANRGEWTAALLDAAAPDRLAPDRLRIDAFEPVPGTAAMFRESIGKHAGGGCVRLHELAMSSQEGRAQIAVYAEGAGTNTLHFAQEGRTHETRVEIALQTLAAFCVAEGLAHIHLAKCDTEGHDLSVLQGARPLLEAGRIDIIQFEYNHRWVFARAFLKDVFDLIEGLDYTLVRVDPDGFPVFDHWHPELDRFFQSNYALVNDRALAWLPLFHGTFDISNTFSLEQKGRP